MDLFSGDLCPEKPLPVTCPAISSVLSVLDKIPALLWATDRTPRFTSLTGAALGVAGISAKSFVGKEITALFPSSRTGRKPSLAHKVALDGIDCEFDVNVNGRELEAHVEPLRAPDGTVVGVIGAALDATARRVAERALRISEQSYRSLIEEAPYAICRVTESGQLLQANGAMLEMLGYDPGAEEDLLMRDLPLIFAATDGFERLRKAVQANGTFQGLETTWLRWDGQEVQVRLGGRAIRDQAGQVLYLDLIAENVTDRKELEAQLSQAQKMQAIGQLAGGVAHDFNNLLTVIAGQIEIVLAQALDSGQRRSLEDAKRAADRAGALIRQLLAFSRRQVLQTRVVDVNALIGHSTSMLARLIRENITLQFLPGCHRAYVKTDPNQMEQVLMNLAVNAQDAMPQGGRLTVETAMARLDGEAAAQRGGLEPGEYVRITVRDTGRGMDPATQARIFEPFFTTKETGGGTGLGLSMAYGVVRQSGGHIQVESQPANGSAFTIYLPSVEGPEAARSDAANTGSPRGHETILLAEDELGVQRVVSEYLRGLGYHVLPACDGAAALEMARHHSGAIHLLLSDLVMPRLGGRELAGELRKSLSQVKVIFISGYAGHRVAEKDLELPGTYFLAKPFSMQRLAQIVRQVLDGGLEPPA